MVELLPALLHISLFLFFAGLSVFLFEVHPTIFNVVTAWIALCVILYACLTVLPIIRKDSPYSAPLSTSISFCLTGIRHTFSLLRHQFSLIISSTDTPPHSHEIKEVHLDDLLHSMSKRAEKSAFEMKPNIDHHLLLWTFESLDEDTKLEKFFEGLPRLCDSKIGKDLDLQHGFIERNEKKLSSALVGLMNRTLSSNLVTDEVKQRRMIICTKVVQSTSLLSHQWVLHCVLSGEWYQFLQCIGFGLLVKNWVNIEDKATSFSAQCVISLTISIVRHCDERWYQLACNLFKASKFLLDKYNAHGDSIIVANVIFIIRRTIQTYSVSEERYRNDILTASSNTLEIFSKLNIGHILPVLQHEFCDLWNQLVDLAQTNYRLDHELSISKMTLKNICKLYVALHPEDPVTLCTTASEFDSVQDSSMKYRKCTNDAHRTSALIHPLQFDELDPSIPLLMPMPEPQAGPVAPSPVASPFNTPQPLHPEASSSAVHQTIPQSSHSASLVYFHPHSTASPESAGMSFPTPQVQPSQPSQPHTASVSPGGDVKSSPQPPPSGSVKPDVSTQH